MNFLVAGQYPRTGGRCSWALCVFPGAVSHGDGMADPSVLAVFQDYVKLMPLVAEANQMGEELEKVGARRHHGAGPERALGNRVHGSSHHSPSQLRGVDGDRGTWGGWDPGPPLGAMTDPRSTPRPRQPQCHLWPSWPPRTPDQDSLAHTPSQIILRSDFSGPSTPRPSMPEWGSAPWCPGVPILRTSGEHQRKRGMWRGWCN